MTSPTPLQICLKSTPHPAPYTFNIPVTTDPTDALALSQSFTVTLHAQHTNKTNFTVSFPTTDLAIYTPYFNHLSPPLKQPVIEAIALHIFGGTHPGPLHNIPAILESYARFKAITESMELPENFAASLNSE